MSFGIFAVNTKSDGEYLSRPITVPFDGYLYHVESISAVLKTREYALSLFFSPF
jgi:hypothetical protein